MQRIPNPVAPLPTSGGKRAGKAEQVDATLAEMQKKISAIAKEIAGIGGKIGKLSSPQRQKLVDCGFDYQPVVDAQMTLSGAIRMLRRARKPLSKL